MVKLMAVVGAFLASLAAVMSVQAATLTDIKGDVQLNRGNGFVTVSKTVTVKPGDKVMSGREGSAKIVYSKDVAILVRSGKIKTVAQSAEQAYKLAKLRGGAMTQAATGGALAAVGGLTTTTIVVGGLVVGGIVAGVVVASNNDDDDTPASP